MTDWTRNGSKRFTGGACLLISLFLFAVPLLGMAAENRVLGNNAGACVCDRLCTGEAVSQECQVCRENVGNCTGRTANGESEPETETLSPCSCADKCREDFVNRECLLCGADRAQCTGQEPPGETETSPEPEKPTEAVKPSEPEKPTEPVKPTELVKPSEPEKPTEPVKPSEPEKPTEPVKPSEPPAEPENCVCKEKCFIGRVNGACPLCKNDLAKCVGQEPATPKFTISILSPEGWYTRKAKATIRVRDVNGTGWETVEAKINSGGSWVDLTDDLAEKEKTALEISENCTIYVTVTDKNGKTHTKNRYIEVFDREPPSVQAGIDGEMLRVEASDDLSGVDQIFVCGSAFSDLTNGTLDVRLEDYADHYQQITVQATDNAGNKSSTAQLKNPYYEEPKKETGAGSGAAAPPTAQPPANQNPSGALPAPEAAASGGGTATANSQKGNTGLSGQPETSGGSGQTSGNGKEGKDPSAVSPTAMAETEDNPFTPEGSATVMDNAADSQGKEFYTIVTPDENVFYLVIDKQRDSENVYFLNAVTESDLMALAQKGAQSQAAATEPAQTREEPEEAAQPPTEPEEPKEEPKPPSPKNNFGILFLILVIALAGGGFGYYFKIYKPRHELDNAEDIDDFEFEGPEEPMVNEDEGEAFGEEPERPVLSEEDEAEQRRLYEEDHEDIPIEGEDDLVF